MYYVYMHMPFIYKWHMCHVTRVMWDMCHVHVEWIVSGQIPSFFTRQLLYNCWIHLACERSFKPQREGREEGKGREGKGGEGRGREGKGGGGRRGEGERGKGRGKEETKGREGKGGGGRGRGREGGEEGRRGGTVLERDYRHSKSTITHQDSYM